MNHEFLPSLLYAAGLIGSLAFSLSGYLLGRKHHLDMMGVFILSFLTANGGGIIRDILTDRLPAVLESPEPFWIVLLVTCFSWVFGVQRLFDVEKRRGFIVSDAVGLCAFALSGALIGIEEGLHFFGILTLALLTSTGGGIIRDLIVNEVPEIFKGGFYGTVALVIGAAVYVLHMLQCLNPRSVAIVYAVALLLRLFAYQRGWSLPGGLSADDTGHKRGT